MLAGERYVWRRPCLCAHTSCPEPALTHTLTVKRRSLTLATGGKETPVHAWRALEKEDAYAVVSFANSCILVFH